MQQPSNNASNNSEATNAFANKSNAEKIELLKKYYEQLSTALRQVVSQLANPELPAATRQALLQKQNELRYQLLQFHGKYLKQSPKPTAIAAPTPSFTNSPMSPLPKAAMRPAPLPILSSQPIPNLVQNYPPATSNARIVNTQKSNHTELADPLGDSEDSHKALLTVSDLAFQVYPSLSVDYEAEKMLLEIADAFMESVCHFSCALARHRNSTKLEAKDFNIHLENNWNIRVPGFREQKMSAHKKMIAESYKHKMSLLKKLKQ